MSRLSFVGVASTLFAARLLPDFEVVLSEAPGSAGGSNTDAEPQDAYESDGQDEHRVQDPRLLGRARLAVGAHRRDLPETALT
jgi:hypothetical protein